jgi:protocatechuate 3,4-dioxygenase beta subunit
MNDPERMPCLSRRRALRFLAGASGLMLGGPAAAQRAGSGAAATECVLTPAQTEGPYFVDERLNRSDLRADTQNAAVTPGALLFLDLGVAAVSGSRCAPLPGAIVDIWQCDALGNYSDVERLRGRRFLRGYQTTDANGRVRFTTIYPGAYPDRALHIHFKVRATDAGKPLEFTSQLYFDDTLTDRVHAAGPYAGAASHRTRNEGDGLYRDGGRELTLDVRETGSGYTAAYDIGVRMA